jgi:hypothetical protein
MILFLSISAFALNNLSNVPLFLLGAVLLLQQQRVLILQGRNLIVQPEVISFKLPQFVKVGLEGVYQGVFLLVLDHGQVVGADGGLRVFEVSAEHLSF